MITVKGNGLTFNINDNRIVVSTKYQSFRITPLYGNYQSYNMNMLFLIAFIESGEVCDLNSLAGACRRLNLSWT